MKSMTNKKEIKSHHQTDLKLNKGFFRVRLLLPLHLLFILYRLGITTIRTTRNHLLRTGYRLL